MMENLPFISCNLYQSQWIMTIAAWDLHVDCHRHTLLNNSGWKEGRKHVNVYWEGTRWLMEFQRESAGIVDLYSAIFYGSALKSNLFIKYLLSTFHWILSHSSILDSRFDGLM